MGRKAIRNVELEFKPDLECVEVKSSNYPTVLIPRDQIWYMEPEQDKPALSAPGPEALTPEQEAKLKEPPAPVPAPVAPPPEARHYLSAPLAQPVPKDHAINDKGQVEPTYRSEKADRPSLARKLEGKIKKRGRSKKV